MPLQNLFSIVPILIAWHCASAQPSNASFLHYTTDQGLSSDNITGIAKDQQGFLWVSTVNGLNRFDGRAFRTFRYNPDDNNSISNDNIIDINLAPDGWLWIATYGGLCRLDPRTLRIERMLLNSETGPLVDQLATHVAFDSKGCAWTTSNYGLHRFNTTTGKQEYFLKTELSALGWFDMYIDHSNRLWMIKETVRRFDPRTERFKVFKGANPRASFGDAGPLHLEQDASGKIWAGTWGGGIWEYLPEVDEFTRYGNAPAHATHLLSEPDAPYLWVGGGTSGLGLYYPGSKQFIEFKPDVRDPYTHNNYLARVLFKDPSTGDVWIGTEVGLEHYAPMTIRFGRAMIPLGKNMGQSGLVSAVVHDHTDPTGQRYFVAVWGTGLFIWDKGTGVFTRMLSAASGMTGWGNFYMFQDRSGYLWACLNAGVGRYDPRTGVYRDYVPVSRQPGKSMVFLWGLEDRRGNLWFGSIRDGLFRYNPQTDRLEPVFYKKELADKTGNFKISGLSEDSRGRLWLACNSGSLVRYDPASGASKQFTYPGTNNSLACNAVKAASNGRVYAAFYSAFLELDEDGKLLRRYTQQDKLRTNRLFFIVEDRQGKIWFNSEYLLHRFDPASGAFRYYGKPDGLFSNAMTDALSITPDGEIFVGFQNAFNYFYPDRLLQNRLPPPIAITSIKVMNKERMVGASGVLSAPDNILRLSPGENFFEIEFAALNFNQQERNRYAYRLEGFNDDWVYTGRPVATFTNLDGGAYHLRMKAANNDGVWNEQGATLEIQVNPPYYRRWWFPFAIALALAGLAAGLLGFRRQQRRRLEKFRESLARDLHDELGSTLSSIRFFSEFAGQQIGNDKPQVQPVLQRISQSASAMSESMQDIIWAMKNQNDQFEDLTARMTEFGLRLLEARNVEFKTRVGVGFSGKQLRPEVRRNVYLIFKEAVNNAAKYAEASTVELDFSLKKGWLIMQIIDDGRGFEPESPEIASGNGLQNMRQRAADIGGTVEITSLSGKGTCVSLRVKV